MSYSSLKAIRQYCLGCGEGTYKAVSECGLPDCPLYVYRFGKNPNIKRRELTEDERRALVERLTAGRKAKGRCTEKVS